MYQRRVRVAVLGPTQAGKTSLIFRLTQDTFYPRLEPSQYARYFSKLINNQDSNCLLELWDLPGDKKYAALSAMFLENVDAVFLVFDVTSYQSFLQALQLLRKVLSKRVSPFVVLLGNKSDAYPDAWQVNIDAVKTIQCLEGALFKLVSAKEGTNVAEVFQSAVSLLISQHTSLLDYNVEQRDAIRLEPELVAEQDLPDVLLSQLRKIVAREHKSTQFQIIGSTVVSNSTEKRYSIQLSIFTQNATLTKGEYDFVMHGNRIAATM